MLRAALLLSFLFAALAGTVAFHGLRTVAAARAVLDSSSFQGEARIDALKASEQSLQKAWSRPTLWDGNALDVLSAIEAQLGELTGDARLYRASARSANAALRFDPAVPDTWVRLAKLAALKTPGVPCSVEVCLERSWRLAPIMTIQSDCARIRIWIEAGLPSRAIDAHIIRYFAAHVGAYRPEACIADLPANERLRYLLLASSAAPRSAPKTAHLP